MKATILVVCLGSLLTERHDAAPGFYSLHPSVLSRARARVVRGDDSVKPALARLRADADAALKMKPPSVMDKTKMAASGDKHDYFSLGPYWWPDPGKRDGLPYVRRDGENNPESRRGTDRTALKELAEGVETLALAYFLTGHEPYAVHAARLVRVWFLDPATRMNSHLRYAQAIPGITDGRGIGIIDSRDLLPVCDGVALISVSPSWTKEDDRGFRAWMVAYLHWLRTSPNGRDEADHPNNHGTWYDVQVAQVSLFLGQTDEARDLIPRALQRRVEAQIEPDGKQPLEIARTKPLGYSLFNLEALVRLAILGEHVGVDGWAVRTKDGRSLVKALQFVAPCVDPRHEWVKKDIAPVNRERLFPLFVEASRHLEDPRFRDLLQHHLGAEHAARRWQLFR